MSRTERSSPLRWELTAPSARQSRRLLRRVRRSLHALRTMAPRAARNAASVGTFPEWTRLRAVSVLVARSRRIVRPAQERAWRAAQQEQERAQRAAARAHGRDQREARRAYQHGREADAAARRSELEAQAGELSCLLQNVLAAPPFRLEQLAQEVTVPPFNPGPLAVPVVPPRSSPAEGRPRSAARGTTSSSTSANCRALRCRFPVTDTPGRFGYNRGMASSASTDGKA
jgi:hypothetical protein